MDTGKSLPIIYVLIIDCIEINYGFTLDLVASVIYESWSNG